MTMTHSPRVTVLIPTYNRADVLGQAIASVIEQTYEGFSLVVADNASTDETASVVSSFNDERIVYVRRKQNLGLLGNFAAGIEAVEADYCLILCDDDLIYSEFLSETVRVLDEHPRVGMVHTAFSVIDAAGEVVEERADWTRGLAMDTLESGAAFIAESMRSGCRVCSSAALMRTAALPRPAFEEEDFPAIDFGLWLRMALSTEIAYLSRPLAAYRIHAGSQSAAFGPPAAAGYAADVEWVENRDAVKRRFLDRYANVLSERRRLRRLARKGRRAELIFIGWRTTLPERRLLPTLRMLGRLARIEPRVLAEPTAWRIAATSMLGARVIGRLKRLRTRVA